MIAAADWLGLGGQMTLVEWGWVLGSTVVIFAVLGPRLWRDIQSWRGVSSAD